MESTPPLEKVSYKTSYGNITIALPPRLYREDVISGSVTITPKGHHKKQLLKNTEILNSYLVCFPEKDFPVNQGKISCEVPAAEQIAVTLCNKKQTPVQIKLIDIADPEPEIAGKDSEYSFPPYMTAGLPAKITGNFDGHFFNSFLYVNGEEAKLLAESGQELIFEVPFGMSGPQIIDFSENDITKQFQANILQPELKADQWDLKKNEVAEIRIQLAGLQGLEIPVRLTIKNENPDKISLEGGNIQSFVVEPDEVNLSGQFSKSVHARAVKKGKLSLSVSCDY